jgi:uncharacterized RDD family membrane protein YckC
MQNPVLESIGNRLLAQIIDGFIIGCFTSIFLLPLMGIGMLNHSADFSDDPYMVGCLFTPVILPFIFAVAIGPLLYDTLFLASAKKATLGMMLLKMQVVTEDGNRLTFRASLARALIKYITFSSCAILWLWPFFNKRQQALHDLAAKSWVIRKI